MEKWRDLVVNFVEKFIDHYLTYFTDSYELILMFILIPLVLIVGERLTVGWKDSSMRRLWEPDDNAKNDWAGFLFRYSMLNEILGYGLLLGIALYIPKEIRFYFGYNLVQQIPLPIVQAVMFFIVVDFSDYWIHRLEHKSEVLWEMHKMHHAPTRFNVISGLRTNPLSDVSIKRILYALPLAIAGSPVETYIGVYLLRNVMLSIQHSEFKWSLGWFGRYVLISPVAHRIHHSVEEEHFNRNLGTVLVWWDKLFGTWYEPDPNNLPRIGVEGNDLNHPNYLVNIYRSMKAAWYKLFT
ncbi:sterol desaturase family protein [Reichenbachiella carrageenanivorans]|uniref:Sterol desaturase family protein n=1 Tax=Reichenbachiella carrageenanivorans TaxID=2979869 RepID=A0ABY6D3U1_9BACT|nr:sterol desaturase family protein [Reichenbachiella carrageenanivorans]UXX80815.1 sterol desaturase family protein [Reichenbachiella carrageenanivorans]